MEKLDNFFEKVNGSYFGIISFLVSGVCIIIAQILYMEADPSFSMSTNFVSDLGTGPHGSYIIFSSGMILTGALIMPFYIYIGWYLQKAENLNLLRVAMIMGVISSIGIILVVSSENLLESPISNKNSLITIATSFFPFGSIVSPLLASMLMKNGIDWQNIYYFLFSIAALTVILYSSLYRYLKK